MKDKFFYFCLIVSVACWFIPFVCRIFFIEMPEVTTINATKISISGTENIEYKVIDALSKHDSKTAFKLILRNNLKCCILNMGGGVMLGIGTLLNLAFNGFVFADVGVKSYQSGLSIESILKVTLPHSFELIGIWLSGSIGFYITWNIIQVLRGKNGFTVRAYKILGIYSVIIFFIILSAAYVEAYISIKM
jgi:uncharacterized membrane protein SpoIIM required for sporulation